VLKTLVGRLPKKQPVANLRHGFNLILRPEDRVSPPAAPLRQARQSLRVQIAVGCRLTFVGLHHLHNTTTLLGYYQLSLQFLKVTPNHDAIQHDVEQKLWCPSPVSQVVPSGTAEFQKNRPVKGNSTLPQYPRKRQGRCALRSIHWG
jgi:hypothetical protein